MPWHDELDVATGAVREPGIPWPAVKTPVLDDEGRDASRRALMAHRPKGLVWVFAYGSLIWNPSFTPAARRQAILQGHHRSFCFWTMVARGTPARPGLGLALEECAASRCSGLALQVDPATEEEDLKTLWAREMYSGVYRPTWVDLDVPGIPVERLTALTFVADPAHPQYCPPLTPEQKATIIAGASGKYGPCTEYVENVVQHLKECGQAEPELERLLVMSKAIASPQTAP